MQRSQLVDRYTGVWLFFSNHYILHTFGVKLYLQCLSWYEKKDMTHVPWCMPGSLTSGFLWSQWREKSSPHSRRMRNPQFDVSGKKPILKSGHLIWNCALALVYSFKFEILWSTISFVQSCTTGPPHSAVNCHCMQMGQVTELRLSCYLVLLSVDSKIR